MKKRTQIRLIYIRYILPPILMLLTLSAMFIPSYRYVIGGKLNEAVSPFTLIANSFDAARRVVFATQEQDVLNVLFSRTVMTLIIAFSLMMLIALAATVYSSAVALRYFSSDDEDAAQKSRTLFVTFIPNRTVLCILQLLCIPLTVFPYILPPLYKAIWSERVGLALMAPDSLMVAAVSFVAIVVLCIISAPAERRMDADIFKKRKAFEDSTDENGENLELAYESESLDGKQNEKIRRILLGIDGENTNENKDKTED